MTVTLNFNEAEAALLSRQAQQNQVSILEFIHETTLKAARNAEYLAKLDRADEQIKSGNYHAVTWAELEALLNL